jgi:UDP-N-acetylglucosamine 2-epimerase
VEKIDDTELLSNVTSAMIEAAKDIIRDENPDITI